MPIIKSEFKPNWWLKNTHLQTVWGTLFKKTPDIELSPLRIELVDGDFIDVIKTPDINNKPIVLILHGLEGSINSHYVKPLIKTLDGAGYGIYFMHFRSCSGVMNRLKKSYSSGDSNDLQAIVDVIKRDNKRDPFAVVGFSMGGNVVLKWLGEQGEYANTILGIAISVPFSLGDCALKLEQGISQFYQRHLIRSCQDKFRQKEKIFDSILNENVNIDELKTFYQFDDKVTAPLSGYKSADDYYAKCSSRQFVSSIRKPTLIIHSKDDPFMWSHTAPTENELAKDVLLELTEHGGHVGFIGGKYPWRVEYWLDHRVTIWLNEQREKLLKL